MKRIPVATLRQNPTQALDEVERGETYIVTRHNREIARLVPPGPTATVTPAQFRDLLQATPLTRAWAADVEESASDFDGADPWLKLP